MPCKLGHECCFPVWSFELPPRHPRCGSIPDIFVLCLHLETSQRRSQPLDTATWTAAPCRGLPVSSALLEKDDVCIDKHRWRARRVWRTPIQVRVRWGKAVVVKAATPVVVDIFAGTAGVLRACVDVGFEACAVDWRGNKSKGQRPTEHFDLALPPAQPEPCLRAACHQASPVRVACPPCGWTSRARGLPGWVTGGMVQYRGLAELRQKRTESVA